MMNLYLLRLEVRRALASLTKNVLERPITFISNFIWLRIALSILSAYVILICLRRIAYVETYLNCSSNTPIVCFIEEILSVISIENVEGFSILVISILYIFETSKRRQKAHYEAWQVIDAASGVETSYARISALQDLNSDSVSLRSIDIPQGDLESIQLSGANLRFADLRGANLKNADLSFSDMRSVKLGPSESGQTASLMGADLSFADLRGADLTGVDLTGADLMRARLHNTRIKGRIGNRSYYAKLDNKWKNVWTLVNKPKSIRSLRKSDLEWADLTGVDFTGIDLREANLEFANLKDANLSKSKIKDASFRYAWLTKTRLPRAYSRAMMEKGIKGANSRRNRQRLERRERKRR